MAQWVKDFLSDLDDLLTQEPKKDEGCETGGDFTSS